MLHRFPFNRYSLLKVPNKLLEATTPCWLRISTTSRTFDEQPAPQAIKMAYNSYETTGTITNDDPPLIVMHGLFGSKGNWNSLCKAYQKLLNCKVYSVGARNHGDSPHSPDHTYRHLAADIHAFMQLFEIKKAKLIGHSMGGRAVMYFTLRYPELVEKLIVVDISPYRNSPSLNAMPPLFEFMAKVHMPKGGTMAAARTLVEQQLATRINDRALRAFLVTNLVQRADGTHAWRINLSALLTNYSKNIANFPEMPNRTFAGPTLFVGGEKSDHIPKNSLPELKRLFPNADLQFIKDAGHWVHSEKSHEFLKHTSDFLIAKNDAQVEQAGGKTGVTHPR